MSLDVWLMVTAPIQKTGSGIFVRRDEQNLEITREEWDRENFGIEPVTVKQNETFNVYSGNITHNLTDMAAACGIYQMIWRPEEWGVKYAREIVPSLQHGLDRLKKYPESFKAFNPPNGWGTYEEFVKFLEEYLAACKEHPFAKICMWR